jgi:formylglycine-generating enzyme required for sulfatase activity
MNCSLILRIPILIVKFLLSLLFIFNFQVAIANNIILSNGNIIDNNIIISIAWDNSWNLTNSGGNFDAVWVFLKGKNSSGQWVHVDLSNISSKHTAESPLSIEAVIDGKGVFVKNGTDGINNIPSTPISLYALSNLSNFSEIRVFAIEMVYIPKKSFYFGDGASISSIANSEGNPILINSESEIMGTDLSLFNPNSQFSPQSLPTSIPANFPKGFDSFYIMKYEISQIQYVDFLNTLSYTQQQNRTALPPSSTIGKHVMVNLNQPDSLYRNGIVIQQSGIPSSQSAVYAVNANGNSIFNNDDDGLNRAANFLNWGDISAYLDWAALRPLTEMEYEKACRGPQTPIAGEFAWGTSLVTNANNPIYDGTVFEGVSNIIAPESGLANHGNLVASQGWGLRGVLRTGFAANQGSTRLEAGASYYGVMELSGNVWEHTIMIAGGGELFIGNFGDGLLNENGDANQDSWCNPNTSAGVLLKGGGWGSTISSVGSWRDLATSDRFYSHLKPTTRRNSSGGRGAR